MLLSLSIISALCAALPARVTLSNLREYTSPPEAGDLSGDPSVALAVIVPARNEQTGIAACVGSILLSRGIRFQVFVINDGSTDRTADIVEGMALADKRVHLLHAAPLPAGWNGKQHACYQGAQAAEAPMLCFLDADVRLHPDALARMATLLLSPAPVASGAQASGVTEQASSAIQASNAAVHAGSSPVETSGHLALVSGFPLQQTGTVLEWLLLPLIHFVLLGLLPMRFMRLTTQPGYAAGCGQFLMVDREAYFAAGGHSAIRETMHDGVKLPRLLRAAGGHTRLADLTELATCRMYHSAASTWNGLAKNATEGLGSPASIVPMTLLLGLGQVLPIPLMIAATLRAPKALPWAWGAVVLSYLPRLLEVKRFRQRPVSAALHPIGVATLLVLQWYALGRKLLGRPAVWKQRLYPVN